MTGLQGFDHGLGELGGVSYESRGHGGFDASELVVEGGGGDPDRVFIGLIGGVHIGLPPENNLTHQLNERGKQEGAGLLSLGGTGKAGVETLGIEESLQDRPSHHTDRTLLDEGGKDRVEQHSRHLQARYG